VSENLDNSMDKELSIGQSIELARALQALEDIEIVLSKAYEQYATRNDELSKKTQGWGIQELYNVFGPAVLAVREIASRTLDVEEFEKNTT
jgi:hypothetical protein